MFDVVPHGSDLVSPIANCAFHIAIGLGFSDRTLNHRSLGLSLDRNGRLESKDGRFVITLQRDLSSTVARRLQFVDNPIRGGSGVRSLVVSLYGPYQSRLVFVCIKYGSRLLVDLFRKLKRIINTQSDTHCSSYAVGLMCCLDIDLPATMWAPGSVVDVKGVVFVNLGLCRGVLSLSDFRSSLT